MWYLNQPLQRTTNKDGGCQQRNVFHPWPCSLTRESKLHKRLQKQEWDIAQPSTHDRMIISTSEWMRAQLIIRWGCWLDHHEKKWWIRCWRITVDREANQ
jgi:hypothetical protein